MASNTLNNRSDGETITKEFFNDIHSAFNGDLVGRNSSGVPTTSQNLGTAAVPWGTLRADALVVGGSSVDVSQVASPSFRVVSGASRSTSNHPVYLRADGSAATLHLEGATTSLIYDVNGVATTLSADLSKASLTAAPGSNNTCAVDDADAADQIDTRLWGEENPFATKKQITIDTVGTEISGKDGKLAAFKHGAGPEYFLARVDTTNNRLHKCKRGYFFDSSSAPVKREVFSDNDVITILSLGWVFLEDDATTIDVSYVEPVYSFTSPSSPSTGDYWYDMGNSLWKRYDGAAFQSVDRSLMGMVVIDTNAEATRCEPFDKSFRSDNDLELEIDTTSIVRAKNRQTRINVAGTEIDFGKSLPTWNITTDLGASADMYTASEQASTYYGAYLKDTGETVLSDIEPHMRGDAKGLYHPHNDDWRFIGECFNDSGSDITQVSDETDKSSSQLFMTDLGGTGSSATAVRYYNTIVEHVGTTFAFESNDSTDGSVYRVRRDKYCNVVVTENAQGDGRQFAVGLNGSPTTSPSGLSDDELPFGQIQTTVSARLINISGSKWLVAGDLVTAHTNTTETDNTTLVKFAISAR